MITSENYGARDMRIGLWLIVEDLRIGQRLIVEDLLDDRTEVDC